MTPSLAQLCRRLPPPPPASENRRGSEQGASLQHFSQLPKESETHRENQPGSQNDSHSGADEEISSGCEAFCRAGEGFHKVDTATDKMHSSSEGCGP